MPDHMVRLGHTVSEVAAIQEDHKACAVRVRYRYGESDHTIIAKRVVLAGPPGIVSKGVKFEPELPVQQLCSMKETPTWAGDWAKVVATFKVPFWRRDGLS